MKQYLDIGSAIVISVTFFLFFIALFVKGFTKDILLEAGVLLVSIKLILMQFQNRKFIEVVNDKLDSIIDRIHHEEK